MASLVSIGRVWVLAFLCLSACTGMRAIRQPVFGSLKADTREFRFEHGVTLVRAKNGMLVALMPDPRTNLVGVDVRYLVGAAEDPPGRVGMAHLVEHLVFNARAQAGGPTLADELADAALHYNAWTNIDETHYTATALSDQLSRLVALEARRMQTSCERIDAATFERERDVVLSEHTWRHSSGHAALHDTLASALWGKQHPYARPVSSGEIAQATREEACAFIAAHYAPDRAILVITGNFQAKEALKAVGAAFAPVSHRATATRAPLEPARLTGGTSSHTADIDEATAFIFFQAPSWGGDEWTRHSLVATMLEAELATLDASEDWITHTEVSRMGGLRAPVLTAAISVSKPERLEEAVDKVFGATATLVNERMRMIEITRASFRTSLVSIYDGFDGAGSWVADFPQYTGHTEFFVEELDSLGRTNVVDVAMHANTVLDRARSHVARVLPSGKKARTTRVELPTRGREHDLQPWRTPVEASEADRPLEPKVTRAASTVETLTLKNGLRVLLAPDPKSQLVDARMVFPHGAAASPADRPALAALTARLIGNDFERLYEEKHADRINFTRQLGTRIGQRVGENSTVFVARGTATYADWHLWRLFWLLDAGIFPDDNVDALREYARAYRDSEDGDDVANRAMEALRVRLFGAGHPYARPALSADDILKVSIRDLEAFRERHYRANGATLIVSGGFDVPVMKRTLEELFSRWDGAPAPAPSVVPPGQPARGPGWIAVADEDAAQVSVTIGFATATEPLRDFAARQVLREVLSDRVRVVREGLGASYGVSVGYLGGGVLLVSGSLDRDRAGKALAALMGELAAVRAGMRPEDFVRARRRALSEALADSAGASVVADKLESVTLLSQPLSFFDTRVSAIAAATPAAVSAAAAADLAEERMAVVVTGPRDAVTAALAAAGQKAEFLPPATAAR